MARSKHTWVGAIAVAALATQTLGQKCYYPNGSEAPDTEKPCSSAQGSACCPDTWECLDNGLCHLPANNLYGRYSCTDKNWKAPGCPSSMCTYDMKAAGGESITQCSNHQNQWCCNADATHVDCCQESPEPRPFFRLQDGQAYATVGRNQASRQPSLASITGLATGPASGGSPSPTQGSQSSQGAPQSQGPSSAQPITSRLTSVSSGPGGIQTIIQTVTFTPPSNPNAGAPNSGGPRDDSGPNIGLIVGCAVGIPLGLALLGIIFWMLRKRRQQKANPYGGKTSDADSAESPNSSNITAATAAKMGKKDAYRHSRPNTSEIDGAPAGPGRPISMLPGRAELDSGAGFQPGHNPYGPDTVGIGGGNGDGRSTWGSAPPGYSPGPHQTTFQHAHQGAVELDGTSAVPAVDEKGDRSQTYQAYRPPHAAAELPAVKTPPEDTEKKMEK